MEQLEFKNVTYEYNDGGVKNLALSDVSFYVKKGDYFCIVGHSGCGKTTLLKHIVCLFRPTRGNVLVDGLDVWKNNDVMLKFKKEVGFVFQNPAYQLFEETVEKDIAFGPKNYGFSEYDVKKSVERACKIVGISQDLMKKKPFELSGGQKRLVAIAGVVALNPKVLILDEPMAGLDSVAKERILDVIYKYNREFNVTIIFVTHSMEDVCVNENKVLILNEGRVFGCGHFKDVFKDVEAIQSIGLDIPDILKIAAKLRKDGFELPEDIYSVKDMFLYIKDFVEKNKF